MVCPVKGDAGFVLEVQTVMPDTEVASLAWVIDPSAGVSEMSLPSLAAVIAPAAIFAVVIALSANSVVPIEPAAATVPVISQIVPDHVQVRAPTV
jgi:hypothetical protein